MTSSKKALGVAMAVAAAGMLSAATPVYAAGSDATVKCFGVNKCAGQNDCKTAQNACKGHGSCKGMGFLNETAKDCHKMGGKVMNGMDKGTGNK